MPALLAVRNARATKTAEILLLMLGFALGGCSQIAEQPADASAEHGQLLWPAPPDIPRFRYLGTLRSAADLAQKHDDAGLRESVTAEAPPVSDQPVIYRPSAIAVRDGLVYVAEPVAKAITVFNLPGRKLFRFGQRDPHALRLPQSIAIDAQGLVHVLDPTLRSIMVFDRLGLFVREISLENTGLRHPVAVAVAPDGETTYVVDRGDVDGDNHQVVAFAADGSERFRLGPRGSGDGRFNIPLAAAVDADGTLYVVDAGNFRVQAFDADGRFRRAFGGVGTGLGQFSRPRAITLDPDGNIYVADGTFNNVQIFNPDGELLMPLGGLSHKAGPGNYALIAGIAVDEEHRLFVVDNYFKKIEIFSRIPAAETTARLVSR